MRRAEVLRVRDGRTFLCLRQNRFRQRSKQTLHLCDKSKTRRVDKPLQTQVSVSSTELGPFVQGSLFTLHFCLVDL